MGTSNWQNIPFCVDALMKINPNSVLDVGVGYGRWGMIVREFCDVWYGRVFKSQWAVHIEGIEAFEKSISTYHSSFYDKIHLGDARDLIPSLEGPWSVIIFGDVLEHFERDIAENLLKYCINHADYVIVNIPLGQDWSQPETYENPFEEHLSAWAEQDFDAFKLRRKAVFIDYVNRPFGSFILSRHDPKDLKTSLFSQNTNANIQSTLPDSQSTYIKALQSRNEQLIDEINFIRNSRGYRILERLKDSPVAKLLLQAARWMMPGYIPPSPPSDQPKINLEPASSDQAPPETPTSAQAKNLSHDTPSPITRTEKDESWVEEQQQNPRHLSINHPEWMGILSSASQLFTNVYKIPDNLDDQRSMYYAELIKEASPPSVTIQGFPITYYHLVKSLRQIAPQIPINIIWHGNFMHTPEDNAWESFKLVRALCLDGEIVKVGFVKKGMAEVVQSSGIQSSFIMNLVRTIPTGPSKVSDDMRHIGIWSQPDWSWKKLPYAMLSSLSLIPTSHGHIINISPRAKDFGDILGINAEYHMDALPQNIAFKMMREMHLNMNISLTECAPMLPLESLSFGSPCLFGPTSHYFLDQTYLHRRLVVPYPDNSEIIAKYAIQALEERDEIIKTYIEYAPEHNQRALDTLANFLE